MSTNYRHPGEDRKEKGELVLALKGTLHRTILITYCIERSPLRAIFIKKSPPEWGLFVNPI